MKIAILAVTLASSFLSSAATKPAKAPAAVKAPVPVTIPKEAVANSDGSYVYTDKQGKQWRYVKTPFGIMKSSITDAPPLTPSVEVPVRAIDKGDTVRFERTTPFGVTSWERKKTELTDDERRTFESRNAKQN